MRQALIDLVSMGMLLFIFPGAYRPDIHKQYGSNSALRMGGESDLESVISSDVSIFGHDHPQALRLVVIYSCHSMDPRKSRLRIRFFV